MNHDVKLVQKCLSGDKQAFCEIVETYKGYVFAIILNFIKDNYIAEDIAQEVFLQAYRSLPQFQNKSFKAWIGKIAVNKAIDFKRAQGKFYEKETLLGQEQVPVAVSNTSTPEELFLDKERRKKVSEVAASLPDIYSRALRKYYFEGKTYRQIALEEGVTVRTVESRLYRAKALFKRDWGRDES